MWRSNLFWNWKGYRGTIQVGSQDISKGCVGASNGKRGGLGAQFPKKWTFRL